MFRNVKIEISLENLESVKFNPALDQPQALDARVEIQWMMNAVKRPSAIRDTNGMDASGDTGTTFPPTNVPRVEDAVVFRVPGLVGVTWAALHCLDVSRHSACRSFDRL